MRKLEGSVGAGSAVLDAPTVDRVSETGATSSHIRRPLTDPLRPRREGSGDFDDDPDTESFLRRNRRIRRGLIPQTRSGRIAAAVAVLAGLGGIAVLAALSVRYLTNSDKFRVTSSQNIEVEGNDHVTRSQMLSVFGGDVDGNLFRVPLEERRAQLEQLPWVEHATIMRLMPNRIRVQIRERRPIAFVRQGGSIGLADADGVLLDIPPDAPGNPNYSFPVVTGLKAGDAPAERAVRMKLFRAFLKDLDSDGKGTSAQLSEVDLSDPEDVKALIPDHNVEVLVHFGAENFLSRYQKFEAHIDEWRQQYARLSSVDMRYERQVVLQMPPKDSTVTAPSAVTSPAPALAATAVSRTAEPVKPAIAVARTDRKTSAKPGATRHEDARPAHAGARGSKQDAAMQKRVDAIKAWMAKRQKIRIAQQPAKVSLLDAVPNRIVIPPAAAAH